MHTPVLWLTRSMGVRVWYGAAGYDASTVSTPSEAVDELQKHAGDVFFVGLVVVPEQVNVNVSSYRPRIQRGQIVAAEKVRQRFDPEVSLVSIGAPELLVLLRRTNPNEYAFIINGIDRRIDARTAGGFEQWIRDLEATAPTLVAVGPTEGRYTEAIFAWLQEGYRPEQVGPFQLFVRRDVPVAGGEPPGHPTDHSD